MRTLLIKRRGHRRKGYHKESGVYVHPTDVPEVIFRARDRGAPGRGPRLITGLKKGRLTRVAQGLGYISEGERISDIPKSQMRDFANDLCKSVGTTTAQRMITPLLTFRKRSPNGFKDKLLVVKDVIARKSKVLKVRRK